MLIITCFFNDMLQKHLRQTLTAGVAVEYRRLMNFTKSPPFLG